MEIISFVQIMTAVKLRPDSQMLREIKSSWMPR